MNNYVYLDYAAGTPVDPRVAKVMAEAEREYFANPSSLHAPGRKARQALESARKRISTALGAKPREVIFTSGSTEGINLAIGGVLAAHGGSVAVSRLEHEAVLAAGEGSVQTIAADPSGVLRPEDVAAAITDETSLVCVQYVNNELGTVQPVGQIAGVVRAVREDREKRGVARPIYLYADAAQAGLQSLAVDRLGVDLLSMGGSKTYGPKGAGMLYVRTGTQLVSILRGGGQEGNLRSGTENVAAALGLAEALELVQHDRKNELVRLEGLEVLLMQAVEKIERVHVNGSQKHHFPGIINLTIDGASGEDLVAHLDAAGFGIATGSACTASDDDPSHVLLAIGLTKEQAGSSLRISLGRGTSEEHVRRFATALETTVLRLRGVA